MTALPSRFARVFVIAYAIVEAIWAGLRAADTRFPWVTVVVAVLSISVVGAGLIGGGVLPLGRTLLVTVTSSVLPSVALIGADPLRAGFVRDGWILPVAVNGAVVLIWRGRPACSAIIATALVATFALWGGLHAIVAVNVLLIVLGLAVSAATGAVFARFSDELKQFAATERETIEWRVAQDTYQREHQERIAQTGILAGAMLKRIRELGGDLQGADREECRVLHQTIRDETRGRRLLNDAVRIQVGMHRRRGTVVQLFDEGGLEGLDPVVLDEILDRLADALASVESDHIIIRTCEPESGKALSIVATTSDAASAALGIDEGAQVDLWLELERPVAV